MNFQDFVRECYLRSTPSIDLNDVSADNPIDCRAHKLNTEEYNRILEDFEVKPQTDEMLACNMWMLQSGPSLVN